MTKLDLIELRKKAEAATPGEWSVWYEHAATEQQMKDALSEQVELTPEQDRCGGVYMIDAEGKCPALTGCGLNSKNNADFLVSFQPRVALALIDRVEKAEALIAKAGKPSPVYKAVEKILDEHSAWIARPDRKVTEAVSLAAVIAADIETGASHVLGDLHERCDVAETENSRLRSLLTRAGEALKPLIRNATAQFDHNVPLDFPRDLNRNIENGRTVAREIKEALNNG